MENISKLIRIIERDFKSVETPVDILRDVNDKSFNAVAIRKEYENLDKNELSYCQVKDLLIRGSVISDETIIYFLPVITKHILHQGSDFDLLVWRISKLNINLFNDRQLKAINILTRALSELELIADISDTHEGLRIIEDSRMN